MGSSNNNQYGITELREKQKKSQLENELPLQLHLLQLPIPPSPGPVEGAAERFPQGAAAALEAGTFKQAEGAGHMQGIFLAPHSCLGQQSGHRTGLSAVLLCV